MNKETSYSDEYLVYLAQSGNSNAYNLLLERYSHKIRKIIFFYTNDPTYVNDLTQEVFLKIYRHLNYFKEESQFSTWLYRITQNTIKNHFRAVSLRLDSELQFADEHYSSLGNSPEHLLISMEFGEQIEKAISKLSEDLRLCYGMHTFEGHSYEDIAKEMNCPIGTVRSRIYRARKLLTDFVRTVN